MQSLTTKEIKKLLRQFRYVYAESTREPGVFFRIFDYKITNGIAYARNAAWTWVAVTTVEER